MQNKIQHITIKSIALLLLIAVVLPSIVKLNHVFENHKHEICINPSDSHFHEVEIDCEIYKFKLNNALDLVLNNFVITKIDNNHKNTTNQYFFINTYKSIGVALRGPPYIKNITS